MTNTPTTDPLDPAMGWQERTILNTNTPGEGSTNPQSLAPDNPDEPDPYYREMSDRWEPVRANLSGISYLRRHARAYLPRFPREKPQQWVGRVGRSVYTPYLARLVRGASALILNKAITLQGGDEAYWEAWRLNVDRTGSTLDDFARVTLGLSISYGHSSILADYTTAQRATLLEQRQAGDMPFLVQVPPWATIGRRHDIRSGEGLTMVRIREVKEESMGKFGIEYKERIRVLTPGEYQVYGLQGSGWELLPDESDKISLPVIPLATTYSQKDGVLMSRPPLEDCAHLNLAHYQRRSDLTQVLTIAGQPLLDMIGYEGDESEVGLSVNNAILYPQGGGSRYTEISGASCSAHQAELDKLQEQITQLGISTLTQQQTFQESGIAKGLDRAESNSMLSVVARDLEQTLQTVLNWCGEYAGREPPTVGIESDFDHSRLSAEQAGLYLKAYVDGAITLEQFTEAWSEGEWLPEGTEVQQTLDTLEAGG